MGLFDIDSKNDNNEKNDQQEQYFELHSSCPVCVTLGRTTPATKWSHANCGGTMLVSNLANYKCDKCGQISHVMNWKYRCPSHGPGFGNEMEYSPCSASVEHLPYHPDLAIESDLEWMEDFITDLRKSEWQD